MDQRGPHRETYNLQALADRFCAVRDAWLCAPATPEQRLQPPGHSWLDNHPVGQQDYEEYSLDWSYLKATPIRGIKYGRGRLNRARFVNGKHVSVGRKNHSPKR